MTTPDRSRARLETVRIPTAPIGDPSALPDIVGRPDLHAVDGGTDVDDAMRAGFAYGRVASIAPYLPQRAYGRALGEVEHRIVVLENEHLRAEILPDLGARVRSLVDRRTDRELLYRNAVVQPANLALRNAWFSGGIEWNIGTIGHSPFTASPLHGRILERADGAASYLAYEYERLRGVVFSIELSLPVDSRSLLVTITIENPTASIVPMYWWSNTAVDETPESRVIVPAASAWSFGYDDGVRRCGIPREHDGLADRTYPARADHAVDYFFDLDDAPGPSLDPALDGEPWIAAVGADGHGLLQSSDRTLRGRKLFVWGAGAGGRRWQSWLSHGTGGYFEIQAGLARTQLEHLPMPAGARWRWTEAYGAVAIDPSAAHGGWRDAVAAAAAAPELAAQRAGAGSELRRDRSTDGSAEEVGRGSGWGALERHRREVASEGPLPGGADRFPDRTLDAEQSSWMAALGLAPWPDAGSAPDSVQRDPWWLPVLEARDDATSHLHRAIIHATAGRLDEAVSHATRAVADGGGWAAERTLGALLARRGDGARAADRYEEALRLRPGDRELIAEAAPVLSAAGRSDRLIRLIDAVPPEVRRGRLEFLRAGAALAIGDVPAARAYFDGGEVPADLIEGDDDVARLWQDLQVAELGLDVVGLGRDEARREAARRRPIPDRWDFRMRPGD